MLSIIFSLMLCFLSHEGGHYFAALYFGKRLQFRFEWGGYYAPRLVWAMPEMEPWKQCIVAAAGFGTELLCAVAASVLIWPWMMTFFVLHIGLYRFYARQNSDFRWL